MIDVGKIINVLLCCLLIAFHKLLFLTDKHLECMASSQQINFKNYIRYIQTSYSVPIIDPSLYAVR